MKSCFSFEDFVNTDNSTIVKEKFNVSSEEMLAEPIMMGLDGKSPSKCLTFHPPPMRGWNVRYK